MVGCSPTTSPPLQVRHGTDCDTQSHPPFRSTDTEPPLSSFSFSDASFRAVSSVSAVLLGGCYLVDGLMDAVLHSQRIRTAETTFFLFLVCFEKRAVDEMPYVGFREVRRARASREVSIGPSLIADDLSFSLNRK